MGDSQLQVATYRGIACLEHSGAPGVPIVAETNSEVTHILQQAVKDLAEDGGDPDGLQVLTSGAPTTAVLTECGGVVKKSVFTLSAFPVSVNGSAGVAWGGSLLATFPIGLVKIHAMSLIDITFSPLASDMDVDAAGDFSVGSVVANDATLDSTHVDMIAKTAIDDIAAGVDAIMAAAGYVKDGTAGALAVYFNAIVDDADIGAGAAQIIGINGTVQILWSFLGNDA